MTDDEADRYYDQWLTAKAQNKKLKEDVAALIRQFDTIEHEQDRALIDEIAKRHGVKRSWE